MSLITFKITLLTSTITFFLRFTTGDPFAGHNGWFPRELEVINYARGGVLPKPQQQEQTGEIFALNPSLFTYINMGKTSDVLGNATDRYMRLTFPDHHNKYNEKFQLISSLIIVVEQDYTPQNVDTNETCKLESNCLLIFSMPHLQTYVLALIVIKDLKFLLLLLIIIILL